jgi:hypothetical protein
MPVSFKTLELISKEILDGYRHPSPLLYALIQAELDLYELNRDNLANVTAKRVRAVYYQEHKKYRRAQFLGRNYQDWVVRAMFGGPVPPQYEQIIIALRNGFTLEQAIEQRAKIIRRRYLR